jgi:hypothetical protein
MGSGGSEAVDHRAQRIGALTRMMQLYADQPDARRLELYLEETAGIPAEVLEAAIRAAIRGHRGSFAPGVGDLWASALPLMPAHQDKLERRAFETLERDIRSHPENLLRRRLETLTAGSGLRSHWQASTITMIQDELARRERGDAA